MKLEAVPSVAKTYQGSVSGAAKGPKAVSVSGSVKIPKAASMPKAVNGVDTVNTAAQSRRADVSSVQTAAENGKILRREVENPDTGEKKIIFDEKPEKDIPENKGVQQNNKQLQEAVDKLKEKMAESTEAVFGIHEGTNRVMIKIVDKETKDVIKEYPPEKTLDMIQKVWEMAGIMVDEKL